jgi:hypothetical protein
MTYICCYTRHRTYHPQCTTYLARTCAWTTPGKRECIEIRRCFYLGFQGSVKTHEPGWAQPLLTVWHCEVVGRAQRLPLAAGEVVAASIPERSQIRRRTCIVVVASGWAAAAAAAAGGCTRASWGIGWHQQQLYQQADQAQDLQRGGCKQVGSNSSSNSSRRRLQEGKVREWLPVTAAAARACRSGAGPAMQRTSVCNSNTAHKQQATATSGGWRRRSGADVNKQPGLHTAMQQITRCTTLQALQLP